MLGAMHTKTTAFKDFQIKNDKYMVRSVSRQSWIPCRWADSLLSLNIVGDTSLTKSSCNLIVVYFNILKNSILLDFFKRVKLINFSREEKCLFVMEFYLPWNLTAIPTFLENLKLSNTDKNVNGKLNWKSIS